MRFTKLALTAIGISAAWCVGLILASALFGLSSGPPLLIAFTGPAAAIAVFILAFFALAEGDRKDK